MKTKKLDIGHVSLALKNEVGGRKSLFSMLKDGILFWLVIIIFRRIYNITCFGANVYMCYDYVHLDTLSDISAH